MFRKLWKVISPLSGEEKFLKDDKEFEEFDRFLRSFFIKYVILPWVAMIFVVLGLILVFNAVSSIN